MTLRTRIINRRYRLERRITLTDTTETWLGFDNVLHRAVAVTLPRQELLRDGRFLIEFLQRSRIATALHHRGIVAAFDSGEDGDLPYLVTEYLGGEVLTGIIRAESPFDVDDVAVLIGQLASALDYAHQRGFVHGALAATDVVVDGDGAAKLLGLAVPTGTPSPTAPSRALSIYDDIEALGALAFEMLTGEEPGAVEVDSAGEAYLIDPDVPRSASDIVAIALGGSSTRFSSAGAFARSLSDWRSFDPGQFFFAPEPEVELEPSAPVTFHAPHPRPASERDADAFFDDTAEESTAMPLPTHDRRAQWLLAGALALAIVAGFIVWRSSEPATGVTAALPSHVRALAQLSGF